MTQKWGANVRNCTVAGALTGFLKKNKKKVSYYNRKMSKEFNDAKIPKTSININVIDIDKC